MTANRRNVLLYGGGAIAAGFLGGAAWQFRPTTPPDGPEDMPLADGDGPSLLVVYGSMMGSTGGQAAWMAHMARAKGYRVALHSVATAPAPDRFDAVWIGSAIRAASWLDPMIGVAAHEATIREKPHGMFQCSMTCAGMFLGNEGAQLTEGQKLELRRDCDALFAAAPSLADSEVAFLPGRLEFHRLSPILRVGYPFVAGSVMRGDYRNCPMAEEWAQARLPA